MEFDNVLGLDLKNSKQYLEKEEDIPEDVLKLAAERKQARMDKNWEKSDSLRDEIIKKGYNVKDTKEDMVLEKIK